jgi:DME family drug/metabolite transporter
LMLLMLVGLAVQLGANLGVQWSFGVVGLAIAIPAMFGVMLTASAAMGQTLLGERISRRSAAAIGLLLASLGLLGLAASAVGKSVPSESSRHLVILGVGAACLAGAIYAVLTITIRHTVTGTAPLSAIVFITTLMGVLSLGPLSLYRLDTQHLLDSLPTHLPWMLAAGILNLIAFLGITKGLELTTVVRVNVLNASQVAMAAIAGMAIFGEHLTFWLVAGVGLTVLGVLMIDRSADGDRNADRHA